MIEPTFQQPVRIEESDRCFETLSVIRPAMTVYARHGKRLLDLLLTIPALALLSPLLLLVAGVVRLQLGTPVLFRQKRPGHQGRVFTLLKFRTMNEAIDNQGNLLPDEMRITAFGQFLRSTSIDELPELVNVLRGEMSLVGPRPLLTQYMELYSPTQRRRHDVLPGITGWAQVNGRNAVPWMKKFELDVWYVDHVSLVLDLRILLLTVVKIFTREGIQQQGCFSSEDFTGSDQHT